MAMATQRTAGVGVPTPKPGSAADQVWRVISALPVNPDGTVYFRPAWLEHDLELKSSGHVSTMLGFWQNQGHISVLRDDRRIVGIQTNLPQSGSQTERLLALLLAYADDHGKVPFSAPILQRMVGARDLHDVTKGLHDLKARGIIDMQTNGTPNGEKVRGIRVRNIERHLRLVQTPAVIEAEASVALDRDEEVGTHYYGDGHEAHPAEAEPSVEPAPEAEVMPEGQDAGDVEPMEYEYVPKGDPNPEPEPEYSTPMALISLRYPLIEQVLRRPAALAAASEALSQAGPAFETEAVRYLEAAEDCYTAFEKEVVDFVKEINR